MKYFAPERYVAFNSPDKNVANIANDAWEKAISDYHKHLKRIRGKLSDEVRVFVETRCLHDAEYLGWSKWVIPGSAVDLAILSVREGKEQFALFYFLDDEPLVTRPLEEAIFERSHRQWLYDEFDVTPKGMMTHEILLSDGLVLKFRFSSFRILTVPEKIKLEKIAKLPAKKLSAMG